MMLTHLSHDGHPVCVVWLRRGRVAAVLPPDPDDVRAAVAGDGRPRGVGLSPDVAEEIAERAGYLVGGREAWSGWFVPPALPAPAGR